MSTTTNAPSIPESSEPIALKAPIVIPRGRITKEQLAAAERARLYHVNKLAAYRELGMQTPPGDAGAKA